MSTKIEQKHAILQFFSLMQPLLEKSSKEISTLVNFSQHRLYQGEEFCYKNLRTYDTSRETNISDERLKFMVRTPEFDVEIFFSFPLFLDTCPQLLIFKFTPLPLRSMFLRKIFEL